MKSIYKIVAAVFVLWLSWQALPIVKKSLNYSFVYPNNGFYDIIYKGKTLVSVNQSGCPLIYFEGKEFPSKSFGCEIQISKDFEYIKFINGEYQEIWENGEIFKDQ